MVTTVTPREVNPILENNLIEVMTLPVDLQDTGKAFESSKDVFNNADVILAGCGITTEEKVKSFLYKILGLKKKVFILDADALNILATDMNGLNTANQYILTPHIGEMSRLTGKDKQEIMDDPIKTARNFALKYKVILVLKSSETIVASPQQEVYICNAGNEGMATAGSGDVLAGIIAGITAQSVKQDRDIYTSAIAGVYIHALAGRFAREEMGSYSLIASDLIKNLSKVFQYVNKA